MLVVDRLCKDYRAKKVWHRAVDELSFEARPGEILGLLGPNGAGKTTALRCCAGILQPTFGHVLLNGFDITRNATQAKAGLAYVPEVPSLYELLTVEEHLRFVAMCYEKLDEYDRSGEALLERFDLADKREELVATLSKGMRQKLSVACAMVHNANIFLFDEPVIGIDPAGVAEMKALMQDRKQQGATILVSTHLLDTAERLCDRVLFIAKGKKLFEGTLIELRAVFEREHATLEELFLELTQPPA